MCLRVFAGIAVSAFFRRTRLWKNEQSREPRQGQLDTVSQSEPMSFPYEDEDKLVYAIQKERVEEVRQPLGKEIDPTAKDFIILRACADQSSVEIAEMIYNWTEPYRFGDLGKRALTKTFENAFLSGRPEIAAFFLKKGASIDHVKQGWIGTRKKETGPNFSHCL
jgi:hypothetical protein